MREYGGDIQFVCFEAHALAKKQFSFKVFFITDPGHKHCLATIAFILDGWLWWHREQLWRFNRKYVEI